MTKRLDTSKKIVGSKQVSRALTNGDIGLLYLAEDADENIVKDIELGARDQDIEIVYVKSMKKLGKLCQIDISAAVAALLK